VVIPSQPIQACEKEFGTCTDIVLMPLVLVVGRQTVRCLFEIFH